MVTGPPEIVFLRSGRRGKFGKEQGESGLWHPECQGAHERAQSLLASVGGSEDLISAMPSLPERAAFKKWDFISSQSKGQTLENKAGRPDQAEHKGPAKTEESALVSSASTDAPTGN